MTDSRPDSGDQIIHLLTEAARRGWLSFTGEDDGEQTGRFHTCYRYLRQKAQEAYATLSNDELDHILRLVTGLLTNTDHHDKESTPILAFPLNQPIN